MNMEIWKRGKENGTLASFEFYLKKHKSFLLLVTMEFLSFECSLAAEDVYE